MKQVQAVYQTVVAILDQHGVKFEDGMNVKEVLTPEMKKSITMVLVAGFKSGDIEFKDTEANRKKLSDEKELTDYVNGLRDNWLRKDTRLNGGTQYATKNPGSRAGSGDTQIKALRSMLNIEGVDKEEIQAAIERRLNEIKPAKTVSINVDDLPAELQEKYAHLIK